MTNMVPFLVVFLVALITTSTISGLADKVGSALTEEFSQTCESKGGKVGLTSCASLIKYKTCIDYKRHHCYVNGTQIDTSDWGGTLLS